MLSKDNYLDSKYMEFSLGNENFAIPLLKVKEVIGMPQLTVVPYTPKYFLGIMNLRGQVLSVIDLRAKLGIVGKQGDESGVIILDLDGCHLGVVVDSINRVMSLTQDDISDPPNVECEDGRNFIEGVQRSENKMTLIVDIGKLLNRKEQQFVNDQFKTAA